LLRRVVYSSVPFTRTGSALCRYRFRITLLGFNVRRYGATLLIKPSTKAIQRIRERLRSEMRALRGSNAAAVLAAVNIQPFRRDDV